MVPKKSKQASLENKKMVLFPLGLVTALAILLLAFEWTSKPAEKEFEKIEEEADFIDEIENTLRDQPQQEQPPPPPQVTIELEIVDNDVEVDEFADIDAGMDFDDKINTNFDVSEEEIEEEEIFMVVEDQPVFPGGQTELMKYLAQISYPEESAEQGIQGTVYIRFVVTKTGAVSNVQAIRGPDPKLEEAAIEHVKKMPTWRPGRQRGKAVNVWYTVPIKFQLQ
jgi:protein TonB